MQNMESLKTKKITSKLTVDDKEVEINEVRKRLNIQQKEIAQVQKGITALETKLEQKRADRHSLLKGCKVDTIFMEMTGPNAIDLSFCWFQISAYLGLRFATRFYPSNWCTLQMDDIRLPMVSGTMDDISQEGDSSQDGDTPMDSMSSQVLYLRNYYYFAVSSFVMLS